MGREWRLVAQSRGLSPEIHCAASRRPSPRRSLFDFDLGGLGGEFMSGHPGASFLSACPAVRTSVQNSCRAASPVTLPVLGRTVKHTPGPSP
jgi:hypothetical protein